MIWVVRGVGLVACVCLSILSTACSSFRGEPPVAEESDAPCPAQIENDIKVLVSVAGTRGPGAPEDPAHMSVRRTVVIAVSTGKRAQGLRVLSSELSVTTIGGTFERLFAATDGKGLNDAGRYGTAGALQISDSRAIDVIPGRLRVVPFVTGSKLRAQTVSVDVLVAPGGARTDEMVITQEAMWDAQRRPLPAEQVRITLEAVQHFTMYDEVRAHVSLKLVLARSRSAGQQWSCAAENRFTLVDRAAATPDLWDLRKSAPAGRSELWLALFNSKWGGFRAVFASPAAAAGFADWLRQTHAPGAGTYRLGLFRPDYSREEMHTVPVSHSIAETFQEVSADDLDALVVGRLGEP
jgi:hypothetical protein